MKRGVKVRLKVDLTNYGSGLVEGAEGITSGRDLNYFGSDRFVSVQFPKQTLDILWDSLEITDEEYLKELAEKEKKLLEEYKSATDITETVGPKGGFKRLEFKYTKSDGKTENYYNGFKESAQKLIKYFEEIKLDVKKTIRK